MSERHAIVIGGGVAGITAALDCAQAGARVTLLEVRPRLGGAAYSFERDGLWLDNGQHVFLRCYTAYRGLLRRLGSEALVEVQRRFDIPVLHPDGRRARLRRSALPAPLHLAGALAGYRLLSARERASAAWAALALSRLDLGAAAARERAEGLSLGQWLAEHGQGERSLELLWDLIALPALNVPALQGSLTLGAFAIQTGLLERNDAGDIGFHLRPFGETISAPAERALERAGVRVLLGTRVESVCSAEPSASSRAPGRLFAERTPAPAFADRFAGARHLDGAADAGEELVVRVGGGELRADAVVCAVPHTRAPGLLEGVLGAERTSRWIELGESPIVNVHVVYDRRVCEQPFVAGVGTPVQYVFDRTAAVGLGEGQCLAVSLSGAREEMRMDGESLRAHYLEALAQLFPRARSAGVRAVYVSREHAATFRATPGVDALRAHTLTAVPRLVMAGAWTATGWPATLEGAVRSGHTAAAAALAQLGLASPQSFLASAVPAPANAAHGDRPEPALERTR